ncbi:hypothetical protein NCCP2716_18240 [Sporosarcina sp. NCCP-2716]|uniref:PepSY domain-containing protein n=1 Tax=Sporosarcina sp. NCCP-2716 TaxID=2943679 RepID=UPI00203DFC8F|nr:PepSY domain-containing protein [Sporosarcina sp. NCCP-2716]GKV69326.1 hypothetical protein NCCP2716_18240 [Sporosarcina sp. NCCP-2716]
MTNQHWAQPDRYWADHWQNPKYRRISIDQAMTIALQQVPGQVVKAELEYDHGMVIYEVEIRTADGHKYEVKIDAATGSVLDVKLD